MYTVTLIELEDVLKVCAQAEYNGVVNKTSLESAAQDDFQEVNRRKRYTRISYNTSQTAKKSAKSLPSSAAVKLPPKALLTRKIFAPLRTLT
jgi:hypothetical protein